MRIALLKTFFVFPLLLIVISACKEVKKDEKLVSDKVEELVKSLLDTSRWVIMPFDTSNNDSKPASLDESEVMQINDLLARHVDKYNSSLSSESRESFEIDSLIKYKMQLVPIINGKGEKEVWINCLCNVDDMNWKKDIIIVEDGGSCYFNCKINLSTKKVYNFQVNGFG